MFRLIELSSSQNHSTGTFSECVQNFGDMFQLIELSSGQNHSTGTFSECVHYGIPYCFQNYVDITDHVLLYLPMYLK